MSSYRWHGIMCTFTLCCMLHILYTIILQPFKLHPRCLVKGIQSFLLLRICTDQCKLTLIKEQSVMLTCTFQEYIFWKLISHVIVFEVRLTKIRWIYLVLMKSELWLIKAKFNNNRLDLIKLIWLLFITTHLSFIHFISFIYICSGQNRQCTIRINAHDCFFCLQVQ